MNRIKNPILPSIILVLAILACGKWSEPQQNPVETPAKQITETHSPNENNKSKTPIIEPISKTPTNPPTPTETLEIIIEKPNPLLPTPEQDLMVVYTHEGNLWLWNSNGIQTQLTESYEAFSPKFSHDGKMVAYLKGWDIYNAVLWVMNSDGSDKRQLISAEDLAAFPRNQDALGTMIGTFDWVPGHHTLAYNTIQLFEVPNSPSNNDLRLVDADTSIQTVLLNPGQGGKFTYSIDGTQIAITTPESLSIINSDGSNRRDILTFPVIYTYSEWLYYPQPVWAPDSGHLRVVIPPQDPLNKPDAFSFVWHIPADGSLPYLAGEFVSIPVYASEPLISPDTNSIIFLVAAGEAFDELELHIFDLSNGSLIKQYTGNISLHNWNPDSDRFVFIQDFGADFYIGKINKPFENITDVPVNKNLSWVTSDEFIFTSGDYETRELRVASLNEASTIIAQPFGEIFSFDFYPKP